MKVRWIRSQGTRHASGAGRRESRRSGTSRGCCAQERSHSSRLSTGNHKLLLRLRRPRSRHEISAEAWPMSPQSSPGRCQVRGNSYHDADELSPCRRERTWISVSRRLPPSALGRSRRQRPIARPRQPMLVSASAALDQRLPAATSMAATRQIVRRVAAVRDRRGLATAGRSRIAIVLRTRIASVDTRPRSRAGPATVRQNQDHVARPA